MAREQHGPGGGGAESVNLFLNFKLLNFYSPGDSRSDPDDGERDALARRELRGR